MKRFKLIYIIPLLVALISSIPACTDDLLYGPDDIGEGTVRISATVQFEPQASALDSRATDGKAMQNITSLSVIMYSVTDTLTPIVYNLKPNVDFTVRTEENLPSDFVGDPAEAATATASFQLPEVEVGQYYMYAVANMGNLTAAQVGTPYQLKHMKLTWNSSNVASNNQMFGYFGEGASSLSEGFDANPVTVSRNSTQFHAWLKRAASKVTIVIDGSQMHNDISVYIHKVTIHDIPAQCYLGADNKPGDDDRLIDGESIYFNAAGESLDKDEAPDMSQYESWMKITRGSGKKGAVKKVGETKVYHPEDAKALYFYENLQGNYKDAPDKDYYDKKQDSTKVGTIINKPGQPDFKDNVPNGSYIEVEGFYNSMHAPNISSGKIIYRFMLGQDTRFDYDAFRNRHYKLTLRLVGYANQPDWHIEYIEETPELFVPDKLYVSYLYNQDATLPIRVKGECTYLDCEIIENNWAPYDSTRVEEVPQKAPYIVGDDVFQWAYNVWDNNGGSGDFKYGRTSKTVDGTGVFSAFKRVKMITPLYVGFLALAVPSQYASETTKLPTALFNEKWHDYRPTKCEAVNKDSLKLYFEGKTGGARDVQNRNTVRQWKRVLMNLDGVLDEERVIPVQGKNGIGRNAYYVDNMADTSMIFQTRVWTRPQTMIKISGFTGNNPFEEFQRKAVVRVRALFKTTKGVVAKVKDVPVYQVRQVVNPKGVWRSWDENKSFKVALKHRTSPASDKMESFQSSGSWKAYVKVRTKDFMYLSGGTKMVGDTIFGDTGTNVEFNINFRGTTNQTESNCAIVYVEYHGYTCTHTICVRQGYNEPLQMVDGGKKWSSFSVFAGEDNMDKRDKDYPDYTSQSATLNVLMTKSPLALGSLFKRGVLHYGIRAKNNDKYKRFVALNTTSDMLDIAKYKDATSYDSISLAWGSIKGMRYAISGTGINRTYSWPQMQATVDGKTRTYTVPEYKDYKALMDNCECGFGIFYGDGATETAESLADATGYVDPYNLGAESTSGMRGAVVFNSKTGNQIFFPLGAQGAGCRRNNDAGRGMLRYGSVTTVLSANKGTDNNAYRPICYNIRYAPGAIYWIRKYEMVTGPDDILGWDINYNDLNFAPHDCSVANKDIFGDTDALPMRLVVQ